MEQNERHILRIAALRAAEMLRYRAALALIGCAVLTIAGSIVISVFDVDPLANVAVAVGTMALSWYAGRNALEASRLSESSIVTGTPTSQ